MSGERGVGRTTLLDYAERSAAGCRVLRPRGLQCERELTFAGLHQLCTPLLANVDRLSGPQREALDLAFGLRSGASPERFVVAMAVLALLTTSSTDQPIVCLVDDAHWFDDASAEVVGFVARRLATESIPVAMVLSVESTSVPSSRLDLSGLCELRLRGLDEREACHFVHSAVVSKLDEQVVRRVVAECRGNPSQLQEQASRLQHPTLAGGFAVDHADARTVADMREEVMALPAAARLLVLLAAADPTGDPIRLWRAACVLDLAPPAAAAAVTAGLVTFHDSVRFNHPFARAAAYLTGTKDDRHRVHRALAEATTEEANADWRAWHEGHAAATVHEESAASLERTAALARARGGLVAEAAFRSLAADLSPDPRVRARRALRAAETSLVAGDAASARRLLAVAQAQTLSQAEDARALWLTTRLTTQGRSPAEVSSMLLAAAQKLRGPHPSLAQAAYADALEAAYAESDSDSRQKASVSVAHAVLEQPAAAEPVARAGLFLQAEAVLNLHGDTMAAPLIKRALPHLQQHTIDHPEQLRWLTLGLRQALRMWDDACWLILARQLLEHARRFGATPILPSALQGELFARLVTEGAEAAIQVAHNALRVDGLADGDAFSPVAEVVRAWTGWSHAPRRQDLALVGHRKGQPATLAAMKSWSAAALSNASGRYADTIEVAASGAALMIPGFSAWCAVELVEAATRIGEPRRAQSALEQLQTSAEPSSTHWAQGMLSRCRAVIDPGSRAERHYQSAISHLNQTHMRLELGRTHLLYGEWLRRQGRRIDARSELAAANDIFVDMGVGGFAERVRRELVATGATVRKRSMSQVETMTAQETQIARMAREGRTNAEIGAELFISSRTVEWHMRKVFQKLGITSRRQLRDAAFS